MVEDAVQPGLESIVGGRTEFGVVPVKVDEGQSDQVAWKWTKQWIVGDSDAAQLRDVPQFPRDGARQIVAVEIQDFEL